ncbi:MAG TPA: fumarylacetoacetase [Fimbriimonadaceae bacterium]|nr:fumarylacetoacetase [Fimbriimonadaceae bacterium]
MRFLVPASTRSWVEVPVDSHFPIQNLPFGSIAREGAPRLVSRIGDLAVDLGLLAEAGLLPLWLSGAKDASDLVRWEDPLAFRSVRATLAELLESGNSRLRDDSALREQALFAIDPAAVRLPMRPGAFVDFYSGVHHASNVGRMFRPDQPPLLPNYRHIPIGYNGRASTVVVSGTDIRRPHGQTKGANDESPSFGPTQEMDFELELGYFLASGNPDGAPIPVDLAEDHMLGLTLVNDWSARDVQRWEYVPLGPFLAKSFATSVSPWIVTLDALALFRIGGMPQDPEPLPYLQQSGRTQFEMVLEVSLQTARMSQPQLIARSNMKYLYWSLAQQLAHQTSNGTRVEPGDLYATGTISGETEDSAGSMLELSWRGSRPLAMRETGEMRTFLEDGDVVTMSAYADGEGYRVGFGELRGKIVPA